MKKLSKTQNELIDYLKEGGEIIFYDFRFYQYVTKMGGEPVRWSTYCSLLDKGLIKRDGNKVVLNEKVA